MFKTQFKSLERKFESPFGIPGAVCSGLVFALAFIGVAGFQDDNQVALGSFLGIFALSTVYYYLYATEETSTFLSRRETNLLQDPHRHV